MKRDLMRFGRGVTASVVSAGSESLLQSYVEKVLIATAPPRAGPDVAVWGAAEPGRRHPRSD